MPSFVLLDASTTQQTLADGEFGFIAETGSLEVDGDAVAATGNVLISVYGLLSSTSSAVDHFDGAFAINIGGRGRIEGSDDAVRAADVDSAFVVVDGRVVSGSDALDIRGAGPISIVNRGTLVGESDGIVTRSTEALTRIVNTGIIDGFEGGIDHLGGDSQLINRGTIRQAESYGFSGAADSDEVRNTGSIRGGVFLEDGDDFVFNRGFIDTVNLGLGDDVYIGRADGRARRVDGRDGEDVFVSSRADDVFRGGTGGDFFSFARRGGDDRIADFDEEDLIDLSAFGFARFRDLRDRIEDRRAGSLIDLSDEGLTIFLRGVEKADLRAADFALEVLM